MPVPDSTPIVVNERGEETHQSWLLIRANRVSHSPPGRELFDSEIKHQHYVSVTITRCKRQRDVHRDWYFSTELLMEIDMSEAQWGGFVSSFGNGTGVPATLNWIAGVGQVPGVSTNDSRLAQSHQNVKAAAQQAMEKVMAAQAAVNEAFDRNAGKKEMRELLKNLRNATENLPGNLEYAAQTLSEHVETVVQKARADVEGMVLAATQNGTALPVGNFPVLEIES